MTEKRESYTSKEMEEVLQHFVKYLNRWYDFYDKEQPYSYRGFTLWDPEQSLYGTTKLMKEVHFNQDTDTSKILIMQVSDGDEGGPSELIAGFQHPVMGGYEGELSWIMQIFDTMPMCIWTNEQGYRSPPEGVPKP